MADKQTFDFVNVVVLSYSHNSFA